MRSESLRWVECRQVGGDNLEEAIAQGGLPLQALVSRKGEKSSDEDFPKMPCERQVGIAGIEC